MRLRRSLGEIHHRHTGKVSDKWGLYLDVYDRTFAELRNKPISMLEIGIQNGGSLEVWAKYFRRAETIIGCDIDPRCTELKYDDDRINVIVADANSPEAFEAITARSRSFDIIIDDGSHTSTDIVATFGRYFDLIKPGGIFIAEDLHCSYWPEYEGGILAPRSSMAFFKLLIDVVNCDHWAPANPMAQGAEKITIEQLFAPFLAASEIPRSVLAGLVRSVEVFDSMAIIRRSKDATESKLGKRQVTGTEASVDKRVLKLKSD